jgi:hypothetical protein
MSNSRWTVAMTALAMAATLAACGDNDSGKSAADSTQSTEAPTSGSTDTPASSAAYALLRNAGTGDLDAGTYGLVPAGPPVKNVAVIEAPAGYRQYEGWTFVTPDGEGPFRALGIMSADSVFGDPCGSDGTPKTGTLTNPGPRVKDLARALTEQEGVTTSKPAPVTLDGYSGLYLDYRIAKSVDLEKCGGEAFDILTMEPDRESGWWIGADRGRAGIWILDVDGDRLLMSWVAGPGTTKAQMDELETMAKSATFEPLES